VKEFSTSISDSMVRGLRRSDETSRNSPALFQSKSMRPLEWGLRAVDLVQDPFDEDKFDAWPFPQLIRGNGVTLLAGDTSLHTVDDSGSNWTSSVVTAYDFQDKGITKNVVSGGVWHFADFFTTWMLFNGSCVIIKSNESGMFGETEKTFVDDSITIQTGTGFHGRLLMGGFSPSDYDNIDWQNIWNDYLRDGNVDVAMSFGLDTNFISWTSIGGGDMLNLFDAVRAVKGYIKEDITADYSEPLFLDAQKRNECGFIPMPWQGDIYSIKPLGNGVMVYGESGVALLFPVVDPIPTFGVRSILRHGVAGRGAVGGDGSHHIFIDEHGDLWGITTEYIPQRLNYNEYLSPLIGQEMAISHDSIRDEFYISGEDSDSNILTFVLTPQGLGQSYQQVTSAVVAEGGLIGVFANDATANATDAQIVTDTIDFGVRGLKTITVVEIGCDSSDDPVYLAVDYKYAKDADWVRSDWILVNDEGWGRIQKTALEFRVCVKGAGITKIDYMTVKWQIVDARGIRGTYASTASPGANR